MSKLREQIEVHVRDAMGDIPTPHMLEWHTDVFMQVITDEVERRIAELKEIDSGQTDPNRENIETT